MHLSGSQKDKRRSDNIQEIMAENVAKLKGNNPQTQEISILNSIN